MGSHGSGRASLADERLDVLRLLVDLRGLNCIHGHSEGLLKDLLVVHLILARWGEIREGRNERLLLIVDSHELLLGRLMVEVNLGLVLEERRLHRLEHELFLARRVAKVLLLSVKEDSAILRVLKSAIATCLRRNDLNVPVVWKEFHVGWAIEENFSRDRGQGVGQGPQLVVSVSEAAVFLELAHAGLLEVAADLRLVVRVDSSNVVSAWIIFRDGLENHGS